jgi:hypothetical protein
MINNNSSVVLMYAARWEKGGQETPRKYAGNHIFVSL